MDTRKPFRTLTRWAGDYLTYNRTEQRGIFVLSLLMILVIVGQALIPSETFQAPPDFHAFSAEVAAFETAWKRAADSDSLARVLRFNSFKNKNSRYHDGSYMPAFPPKPLLVVDLNTADTFELQQLRGIGPSFARRIVNYRERLHGFYEPHQLMEVFGMDTARFRLIEQNLAVTRDSIHPMDLNIVTFKELLRHPYFPFPVARNIMMYRQKNKIFRNLDELKGIQGINDSLFSRMVIYLRIGP